MKDPEFIATYFDLPLPTRNVFISDCEFLFRTNSQLNEDGILLMLRSYLAMGRKL